MALRRRILSAAVIFIALSACAVSQAQEYRFAVPKLEVELTVRPDATVVIDYRFHFANQPGAHEIDVVDVGMPTEEYQVLSASIDGQPLYSWQPSTYIDVGPEVKLGGHAIPAGGTGVFECTAEVRNFVFEDRSSEERASVRFTPTWFGKKYVVGETELLLIVKFPEGVHPDDVVWHKGLPEFMRKGVLEPDGAAFVSWSAKYRLTGPRMFGCSFPRSAMNRVVASSLWKDFLRWWDRSKRAQQISGGLLIVLFAGLFFAITRGTGCSVFVVCVALFLLVMWKSPVGHLAIWLVVPAMAFAWLRFIRPRRPRYMPALARVERGKVRRGLTAAEAAVLLERPLEDVLRMVISDLLRKGVVRVSQPDPLWIAPVGERVAPNAVDLPDGGKVGLEPYEVGFLDVLAKAPEKVDGKDFHEPLRLLVGLVRYKLEGYDPEGTREYYRRVADFAWDRLDHEGDPDRKEAMADRHINWLTMAEDFDERMEREEEEEGWYYRPRWYYPHGRIHGRHWLHEMRRSVGPVAEHSARGILEPVKGIDLSGVDRFTRETLSEIAHELSSGGSGCVGGGCACACAGCACACACAGGGR